MISLHFQLRKEFKKKSGGNGPSLKAILLCILCILVFYKFLDNFTAILINLGIGIQYLFGVVLPILIGSVVAYFLFRPMYWIERKLLYRIKGAEKHPRAIRFLGVIIIYAITILCIVGFLKVLIPSMVDSVRNLSKDLPNYINQLQGFLTQTASQPGPFQDAAASVHGQLENAKEMSVGDIISALFGQQLNTSQTCRWREHPTMGDEFGQQLNTSQTLGNIAMSVVKNTVSIIISAIAVIFSGFYLMLDKENIGRQCDRFNRNIMRPAVYDGFNWVVKTIDNIFYRYFAGKILTSAFIGFLMYLGLVVLHVQYAPLIGLIVGVTNVIPYFGPIVGSVPGILLTLMYNPMLALEVAIWNLIVQQFDGNVLGPNVLGHIVELNPFWVLVSVMIGGSILGPFGMFVAIPVGAVIRVFINEWMRRKEEKQKTKALPLPTDPRDGAEVDE